MASLRDRLRRMLGAGGRSQGGAAVRPVERGDRSCAGRGEADGAMEETDGRWAALGLRETAINGRRVLVRRMAVSLDACYGRVRLGDVLALSPEAVGRLGGAAQMPVAPRDLVFLDAETTGLGSGAGTFPFLYGLARFAGDHVLLEQFLVPAPEEEPAALEAVRAAVEAAGGVVTFNGKAFDWNQLVSRCVLCGVPAPCDPQVHLDLLYPARRLWRAEHACDLSTLERLQLGASRAGDVPGALVPEYYRRYLATGEPAHLAGVLSHNERDVLALVALLVRLGRLLEAVERGLADAERAGDLSPGACLGLARILERDGRWEEAAALYERLLEVPGYRREARQALTVLYKRLKRWEEAVALWEAWLREPDNRSLTPYVELAKYLEHQAKDYDAAAAVVEEALWLVRQRRRLARRRAPTPEEQDLLARAQRLAQKRERHAGGGTLRMPLDRAQPPGT
ncbi:MAG: ribonuclease H-like domain-containing protein [Calditerricola sp.]|nr:ribonuclease H-like domain-containing protein [Calditerricola sp.]